MKVNFRRILHYLWPHIKKHKGALSLVLLSYAVGVILNDIIQPLVIRKIIDTFSSGLERDLIYNQAWNLGLIVAGLFVFYNIAYRTGDFAMAYFESKVMKRLYDFTFHKLLGHSYNFFSSNFSGSIIAKSKRFTKSYETFADIMSFQMWFSFVTLSGILSVLFFTLPTLAWMFLGWAVLYIAVTLLFISKKIRYDAIEASADSAVTGRLSDVILNVLNVKMFSSDNKEKLSFADITEDQSIKQRKAWYFGNCQNMAQAIMMGVLQIAVLFTSIHLWHEGKMSLGTFILLQTYLANLFNILWNLGHSLSRAVKSLTEMQEVVDIFDTPLDILDPKKPEKLKIKEGHIVFDNVSFAYKNGNTVLENFNLDIQPGERVGLVGHSGAGKSTITKLILRFADTSEGDILIDGQKIRNITQNDLRAVVSYVPQEPILFHRSIRENIAYGRPKATKREIEAAAKGAFAHEFVSKLPKGYDTMVGERGIKLSGGERQRIAIARAMLKNSPILVLDEATSSLDSVSESYIQEALGELMKGKTTLVIAHRLSTVSKMDRIVVLESGKIVEMGTHQELIKQNGVYADLWNHQSGGFLSD